MRGIFPQILGRLLLAAGRRAYAQAAISQNKLSCHATIKKKSI